MSESGRESIWGLHTRSNTPISPALQIKGERGTGQRQRRKAVGRPLRLSYSGATMLTREVFLRRTGSQQLFYSPNGPTDLCTVVRFPSHSSGAMLRATPSAQGVQTKAAELCGWRLGVPTVHITIYSTEPITPMGTFVSNNRFTSLYIYISIIE
jgi:hypothetical protein